MSEPTHRQHKKLEQINMCSDYYLGGKSEEMDMCFELVRSGYLKNLVNSLRPGWYFKLTQKAEEYLESFDED